MPAFSSSRPSGADGIQHNCQSSKKVIANLTDPMSRLLPHWRTLHREPGMYKGILMILLNIQTSPRGSKSISTAATDAFVEAYRTAHPDVTIDNLNVWEEGLPEFS